MSDTIFFAPLRVPVVDVRTGLMSREWILFFQSIYLRIGGAQAFSPDELQLLGDVNDATDDGSEIRANTADLERAVALADELPAINPDIAELQALSASFSEDSVIARFTAQWDGLTPASGGGVVKFLRADGAWVIPAYPAVPAGANPTANVGPAVVNGAALTFMRSDAAPAIDLTATYPWTGPHTFNALTTFRATASAVSLTGANVSLGIGTAFAGGQSEFYTAGGNPLGIGTAGSAAVNFYTASTIAITIDATQGVKIVGKSGFNNTAPIAKPTITGSRAANAALASLLTSLASYGLVTDSTTI